jgi:hypothetical protein
MKFKNLFTRKKIWIPIIAGITVILLILFFVLSNRNYHSPEDGNAAFYEYPSTAVDSIVEKMNAEARASSLIFLTNGKDSIANLKDVQTSFSGYFYLEQNNCEILNNFEILPTDKKFIRAISEDLLPEFSNDSVMFVSPNLLNTINDSLILSRYYTYQAEQLRLKNVNSLVMQFEIPEKCDSSSENQIVNKLAIKLNILHENKILSIISLRDLPEKISDNNKKFLVEIITKLSKSGLCGIIIYESSQFDLLNETGFDGLIILNIDNGKLPEKETLVKSDILLSSSNAVEENKELTKLIRKSNSKEDLFLKSSKVLRAGLWANQKN